ncbi:hypothetical protein GQF01_17950 [Paenibacillus sp. 5J-6]|uniref:Uncharacterized protein n=1 Tax=Paenibacillus silvestris TaxID=2606219 RepID=A0A6L8V3Z0_9BACL|nr:putative cyclic bacteriocin [Paenibacillus silvestris]MZQ84000.1 hypothetical protein [Paenibacillus silvestris]
MVISNRKGIMLWTVAGLAACLAFILTQGILFQLYGYVSWTGVGYAAVSQILNIILTGSSIYSAVVAIVGVFLGGPIIALLTQIGITAIRTWVRELGFAAVVSL